jgi:hypothetical protein
MKLRDDYAERVARSSSRDDEEKGMRNANVSNIFKLIAVTVVAGGVGVGAVVLLTAVALTMASPQAAATPQFSQQTKLPCGQCHSTPSGGGKLKPFGERFKAKGNKL